MRSIIVSVFVSSFILFVPTLQAANFDLTPSVNIGYKSAVFGVVGTNTSDARANFTTLNLSLAASSEKYYFVGKYELPISGGRNFSYDGTRFYDDSISRTDANFTVGYRLNRRINIFGGYLTGKSTLFRIDYNNLVLDETFKFDYQESGPFVGFSAGKAIGKTSNISASFAYGFLAADITFGRNGLSSTATGLSSTGYSVSVDWSSQLEGSLVFNLGYRINNYSITGGGLPAPLLESFNTFSIGISKYY